MSEPINLDKDEFDFEGHEIQIELVQDSLPLGMPPYGAALKLSGEINLYSAQFIKERLTNLLEKGFIVFLLDLNEVKYIDSSGLGVFMSIHSKLLKTKGGIAVCAPSSQVNRILELTKLKNLIKVADNFELGLRAILRNQ